MLRGLREDISLVRFSWLRSSLGMAGGDPEACAGGWWVEKWLWGSLTAAPQGGRGDAWGDRVPPRHQPHIPASWPGSGLPDPTCPHVLSTPIVSPGGLVGQPPPSHLRAGPASLSLVLVPFPRPSAPSGDHSALAPCCRLGGRGQSTPAAVVSQLAGSPISGTLGGSRAWPTSSFPCSCFDFQGL